jgi:polysaccharide chain length determinant protein (PEP-CTERM system associated)
MQQQVEAILSELTGLWRFRWLAVAVAWVIALGGWMYVLSMPNTYEATARVYVDASSALRPLLEGLTVETNVDAQLQFVRQTLLSRPQLERVARVTDLDLRAKTPQDKQRLIDGLGTAIGINAAPSISDRVQDKLYVISYRDRDRATALAVVDTLLKSFVEDSMGAGREGSETAQRFLREQIKEYETRLSSAEARLADFKRKNVGLMPGEQGDYFTRLKTEMDAIKRAEAQLAIAANKREALARQLRGEQPYVPGAAGAAGTSVGGAGDTAQRLKEAQARIEELRLRFTDKHPEVVALKQTIAELEDRQRKEIAALQRGDASVASLSGMAANPVYQNIQMQLNQADVEVAALRGEIADRQRAVGELQRVRDLAPEVEAELARLNRDYGVTRTQYDALVERLEKARISEEATQTGTLKFEIIDPPIAKFDPVAPNRFMLSTAVLMAALGAGVALAWLLNQLRPVFSSARKLGDVTGLPVLGAVSLTVLPETVQQERRQFVVFGGACAGLVVMYGLALLEGMKIGPISRLLG